MGAAHVLTGPDHVAAVLPLALRAGGRGRRIGLAWGLGHSTGILFLGLFTWLFNLAVAAEQWSVGFERGIGVLLVIFGAWTLARGGMARKGHAPLRSLEGLKLPDSTVRSSSEPLSTATPPETVAWDTHKEVRSFRSAYGFGVLHGAAGVGHMLGLLPALMLRPWIAIVYLGAFIGGSTVAMMTFARIVGAWSPTLPERRGLALQVSGLIALVVGGVWFAQTL
ncbi:MAG: hypothetical protein KTR25_06525 [Myxococcales bacterium]|nr:hypothetical protein [Myxococcales bacterium]